MAELKNNYNRVFIEKLSTLLKAAYPKFDSREFQKQVFDSDWKNKELKERMRHITVSLKPLLPKSYTASLKVLEKVSSNVDNNSFEMMLLPDYVEVFGLDHWKESVDALEKFTSIASSEFAVRAFLLKDGSRMIKVMTRWSKHKNYHVRRLASEGSRPRLPWAVAIPFLKSDPTQILPILERLKTDPELYVRRSVANSLNDISKDNPAVVLKLVKKWKGEGEDVDWVIKHALRTLLKAGNPKALAAIGYGGSSSAKAQNLALSAKKIKIGGELKFSFDVTTKSKRDEKVRLEYVIYYMKKNGRQSRKVFVIGDTMLKNGSRSFAKKKSFREMSTRKHHPGEHRIAIVVNGVEQKLLSFTVVV